MDGQCLKNYQSMVLNENIYIYIYIYILSKFNDKFIKNYNEDSNKRYILEIAIE